MFEVGLLVVCNNALQRKENVVGFAVGELFDVWHCKNSFRFSDFIGIGGT